MPFCFYFFHIPIDSSILRRGYLVGKNSGWGSGEPRSNSFAFLWRCLEPILWLTCWSWTSSLKETRETCRERRRCENLISSEWGSSWKAKKTETLQSQSRMYAQWLKKNEIKMFRVLSYSLSLYIWGDEEGLYVLLTVFSSSHLLLREERVKNSWVIAVGIRCFLRDWAGFCWCLLSFLLCYDFSFVFVWGLFFRNLFISYRRFQSIIFICFVFVKYYWWIILLFVVKGKKREMKNTSSF